MMCTTRTIGMAVLPFLAVLLIFNLGAVVDAHGLMTDPPQRGILGGSRFAPGVKPTPGAPRDCFAHFPSGEKCTLPGCGKRSQIEAADPKGWKPFAPERNDFVWRAGVCGDAKKQNDHLRGGKYYFGGRVTRSYKEGGVIKLRQTFVTHHNGHVEIRLCDISKCGGEINERCFREGHCRMLKRAQNQACDSGVSKKCGPIDRNYSGRWYLPCSSQINDDGWDDYLGDYAIFQLPKGWHGDHFVLHWFWSTAHDCNPPGVIEYFEGPDRPRNWGRCKGQAGAIGGYTKVQNNCSEGRTPDDKFPEEYFQCADIKIERAQQVLSSLPIAAPRQGASTPHPSKGNRIQKDGANPFQYFNVIIDGKIIRKVLDDATIRVKPNAKVAIEVVTDRETGPVRFYIDDQKVWEELAKPYFLYGNIGNRPGYLTSGQLETLVGRRFQLMAQWMGYSITANIQLKR